MSLFNKEREIFLAGRLAISRSVENPTLAEEPGPETRRGSGDPPSLPRFSTCTTFRTNKVWAAIVSAGMSVAAWGQSAVVNGVVSDPDSNRVPSAPVEAKNTATGKMTRAMTNARGEYSLSVPAGTYDLSVAMPCCQWGAFSQGGLALKTGEKRSLDIRLPWGANLGTLGDGPILALNAFRERATVASGPTPRTPEGKPDI